MTQKVKKFYFSAEADLLLAREVIDTNPFRNKESWGVIGSRLSTALGTAVPKIRTLKDRLNTLLRRFKAEENLSRRK